VGGMGGWASGHWGIVVDLEDGVAAPDEDPRRPMTRSSSVTAKPDDARGLAWDCCNLRKGRSERRARALDDMDGISPAWMRRRRHGDSRHRSDRLGRNGVWHRRAMRPPTGGPGRRERSLTSGPSDSIFSISQINCRNRNIPRKIAKG
jgi:hypothetical protein